MSTTSFPPTARHFDVYEFVAVLGHSTRQAAEKFQLSQTRVCQLVHKVVTFMAEVMPGMLEAVPEPQRLALSKNVAALRLEHLYQQSLAAWKTSGGESWRTRAPLTPTATPVKTTWKDCGKTGYLTAALKISQAAMELALPLPIGALAADESESPAEPQTWELDDERAGALSPPPNGDCSEKCEISPAPADRATEPSPQVEGPQAAATPFPLTGAVPQSASCGLFSEPANAAGAASSAENGRLSRAQRRARQREARRLLKRQRELAAAG